jgi:hypothetical protein
MVKIVISDFPDPDQRTRILAMPNNLIIYTSAFYQMERYNLILRFVP